MTEETSIPEFPAADYYSVNNTPEVLVYESAEEALIEFFNKDNLTEQLRDADGTIVYCYQRRKVPTMGESLASDVFELIEERLYDNELLEPGCPEPELDENLKPPLAALLQAIANTANVWACEVEVEITLTKEECQALLMQECPHLFTNGSRLED